MPDLPRVSILIPTLNEEMHLGDVLDACVAQTYPADLIDVVVVDGGSTDGTRHEFERHTDRLGDLAWIDNPDTHQAAGLNLAAARSKGDVLVRWDAHAGYPDDYVELAVHLLADPEVDVIGGQWTPTGTTWFETAAASAMGSRMGVGSDRYSPVDHRREVDTVSCGVMTRSTFDSVGGFDPTLWPAGEDADLMFRIRASGGAIVLDPSLAVEYYPRGVPTTLMKQYYGYGLAKAAMLAKHGAFPSPRPLAPALLVAALAAAAITPQRRFWLPAVAGAYGAALVVGSVASVQGTLAERLGAAAVAPLMHIPYGAGVWVGLVGAVLAGAADRPSS